MDAKVLHDLVSLCPWLTMLVGYPVLLTMGSFLRAENWCYRWQHELITNSQLPGLIWIRSSQTTHLWIMKYKGRTSGEVFLGKLFSPIILEKDKFSMHVSFTLSHFLPTLIRNGMPTGRVTISWPWGYMLHIEKQKMKDNIIHLLFLYLLPISSKRRKRTMG